MINENKINLEEIENIMPDEQDGIDTESRTDIEKLPIHANADLPEYILNLIRDYDFLTTREGKGNYLASELRMKRNRRTQKPLQRHEVKALIRHGLITVTGEYERPNIGKSGIPK